MSKRLWEVNVESDFIEIGCYMCKVAQIWSDGGSL